MTKQLKRTEHAQSIYLDDETYKYVKEMSRVKGYSVSGIMRALIRQEHARQEQAQHAR